MSKCIECKTQEGSMALFGTLCVCKECVKDWWDCEECELAPPWEDNLMVDCDKHKKWKE